MNDKKLFLLDAYALIYRAYYALLRTPRITSDGRNTSAIFGFCNTLHDVLSKENPPYMAVCFDPHGPTFRHEAYAEYKAGRDKQPEDITFAIPYIKDIIEAYGIRVVEVPGYEADDVIGTLSVEASREGFDTFMMTPDKDYGQLVRDNVYMYRPALKGKGFEVRGPQQVCERYGIARPEQVIDLLALEGDASDNVPGCPGVGEKTAAKLIAEWGSVEGLLDHVDDLKGALKTKIETNAEQIRFSKFLVTIKTDVPVEVTPDDLVRREPDVAKLKAIFDDLEFKSFGQRLLQRIGKDAAPVTPAPPAVSDGMGSLFDVDVPEPMPSGTTLDIKVDIAENAAAIAAIAYKVTTPNSSLLTPHCLGVCLWADGEEAMTAQPVGLALSIEGADSLYVSASLLANDDVRIALEPIFNSPSVTIAAHDVKRLMILLRRMGISLTAKYFDTSVAHYILKPDGRHDLADVAMAYGNIALADLAQSALERKRPLTGSAEYIAARIAERAEAARMLVEPLRTANDEAGTLALLDTIEMPLVAVLADMEWTGVRIDTDELAVMSKQLTERLLAIEEECHKMAGGAFNINSPAQVGEVLFGRLKIDEKVKRTKSGAWSVAKDVLDKYRDRHPIVDLILQARALRKLLGTYVDALPQLINPVDGKVHTTYNQTLTTTGRISSVNPNLQNIPIRTADGREIRRAFIADPGCVLISADYSQIELRLMADMSGDPAMIDAFARGADIHRSTAAKIYKVDEDAVTDNQRREAKVANFGIPYGITPFGLSKDLGMSVKDAKALIDGYFAEFADIHRFQQGILEQARTHGYVTTLNGRRRYIADINSRSQTVRNVAERNAINAPIQGTAADIIKIAMIRIAHKISELGLRSRMILQVHDELVFNVPVDEQQQMLTLVTHTMEDAYSGRVHLTVSAGAAPNWLQAH